MLGRVTPYTDDGDFTLYQGDALTVLRELPPESVHACVTSPPYWGLRDYGTPGQLGLEPTPEEYVARMVEVFREVRRVLRKDGTLWLNIGDSYASGMRDAYADDRKYGGARASDQRPPTPLGLKPKDLCGVPWRLAFALQADGWYLRADIIWAKPNPMPESVTDRPTKSHEYVFLLSKSPRYFFDQEAVRERYSDPERIDVRSPNGPGQASVGGRPASGTRARGPDGRSATRVLGADGSIQHRDGERWPNPAGRNVRSVWEIATAPSGEAHFATFPPKLAERCILAATSERGCCPECGKPWERETEISYEDTGRNQKPGRRDGREAKIGGFASGRRMLRSTATLGWRPGCDCDNGIHGTIYVEPIPCVVLDPFLGSGTTALVARKHGRKCIGIELSEPYCAMAARRNSQLSLLA